VRMSQENLLEAGRRAPFVRQACQSTRSTFSIEILEVSGFIK
jgi:hypothetical protein